MKVIVHGPGDPNCMRTICGYCSSVLEVKGSDLAVLPIEYMGQFPSVNLESAITYYCPVCSNLNCLDFDSIPGSVLSRINI